uniref:Transmembrane protein n=1 Tax=Globodera pallida TaxID=36090 RepID=A0A183BRR3_GLOPA
MMLSRGHKSKNGIGRPVSLRTVLFTFGVVLMAVVVEETRSQRLNSVSTTGLLVGKGTEVKAASVPLLPEPMLEIPSHSAPVSPSELDFARRKRRAN